MLTKKEVTEAVAKHGTQKAAAAALGVTQNKIRRVLGLLVDGKRSQHAPAIITQSPGGLDSLRSLFGREEIAKRKITRVHTAVEKFIATTLKAKGWMFDNEVRDKLGLSTTDFALARQEHSSLLMEPLDENRRKRLIWVHPTYLDKAHDIINGGREL